jgi:hypothetical protein
VHVISKKENDMITRFFAAAVAVALLAGSASLAHAQPQAAGKSTVAPSRAAETYVSAEIDKTGQLRITTTDGRIITPQKLPDQVGFDMVKLSDDGRAVGWVALYKAECCSYPLPEVLQVYSGGKSHKFSGDHGVFVSWNFVSPESVAFYQNTAHGDRNPHYELREISTGRLLEEYNPGPRPWWTYELDRS